MLLYQLYLKNEFKSNLKKCWCIPQEHNAAFVVAMEDVHEVYSRPMMNRIRFSVWTKNLCNFLRISAKGFSQRRLAFNTKIISTSVMARRVSFSLLSRLPDGDTPMLKSGEYSRIGPDKLSG